MAVRRVTLIKCAVGLVWLSLIVAAYYWINETGIPLRHLPRAVQLIIRSYGAWGPLLLIGLYLIRTVVFVPTTALILIGGSLYGPVWGTLLNVFGENLSACVAFGVGRFLGRRFVREHEHGLVKKYDELMTKDGFSTIIAMRILFFPFDVVNYVSGMTGILFREYALATFIGLLPATVTFTVLGNAFDDPHAYLLFGVLLVATIGGVIAMRRSKWVKEKLFVKKPEHVI